MPKRYFIHFAVTHPEFRIPELLSVAKCYGFIVSLPPESDIDNTRPFMYVEIEDDENVKILAQRCILVKAIYELWADGVSYDELHAKNKDNRAIWDTDEYHSARFRFNVMAYSHTISKERQRDIMNSFAYMGYQGKIDMNNPEFIMACIEEYPDPHGWPRHRRQVDGEFRQVVFGRLVSAYVPYPSSTWARVASDFEIDNAKPQIAEGTARKLIAAFDVKKRTYYGNTSMEAEVSLLMANQTLAAPGKLIYDPFAGTGSMLYANTTPGIQKAAAQYGVLPRILDLCTFDVTQGPLRRGGLFDAIVTDPPYGVRAGAKRLGRKDGQEMRTEPLILQDGTLSHTHKTYVPPTKPYELSALASDLVELARYLLVPGGRLVFFLPTVTDDYAPVDVPRCEGMQLVANSLQNFGKWGRRLITMQKTTKEESSAPTFGLQERGNEHTPAHKNFRDKYFKGFRKDGELDMSPDAVDIAM